MGIIVKPIITEKMTNEGEKNNKYAFVVSEDANKIEIKGAVESKYDVTVEAVNTMIQRGKRKQRFTKAGVLAGKTARYKKAVVTVKEGDIIDFYSNI